MAEIIDLYTVDRELTGKTARRDEPLDPGTYRMVIHVCIFNRKGEMLIQKRADDIVRWPSYWDISIGSDRRPALTVNFNDGFDDFYTVETDLSLDDLHLQAEEVVDARWASREDIEAMIDDGSFIPYQKGLLGYLFFTRGGKSTWDLADGETVKE